MAARVGGGIDAPAANTGRYNLRMSDDGVIQQLTRALERFDWAEAQKICDGLIVEQNSATAPFPEPSAKTILTLLRRKRQFHLMGLVADAFVRGGLTTPPVLRQYAQALIDEGNLVASQMVLQTIIADDKTPGDEIAEAKGLLGRIFKQLYVNAKDPANPRQRENLSRAIAYYYAVYQTKPERFLWHGINTVALLARAQRDSAPMQGYPEYRGIALHIQDILAGTPSIRYWDRATAVEAAVALGDTDAAFDHALEYARDKEADAFEIGSLLRQLTEVWQLSPDVEPGNTLLPILKAAMLKREGGTIKVAAHTLANESNSADASSKRLERVFGTDRYQPLGWLKTGLKRCEAIGAVETVTGKRIGTGFLVKASDFFPDRDQSELLFLTNAHVISPVDQPFPGAIPAEAAQVVFEAMNKRYDVADIVWSSSPFDLDASFLSLDGIENHSELCPLTPAPEAFDLSKKPRVYVIGYPLGGPLSISLQDSHWIDIVDPFLHYRTPTEPGSSGSPVFDDQYWTVIGLHHAGEKDPRFKRDESDEANEAIAITAIQQRTRAGSAAANT